MIEQDSNRIAGIQEGTLYQGLREYGIGGKIRRLRLRKSMGLTELGKHTSLSPAMLSKLENNHVIPTLPTLLRIAMVFSVGLDYFFEDENSKRMSVVRGNDRQEFHEKMGGQKTTYKFQSLDYKAIDRKSSAFIAEFESMPPEDVPLHEHIGSEFIYLMEGKLGITMEGKETALEAGDSTYFDPSYKHGYRRIGSEPCKAIVVTVP
ncbi:XRE family transcriptional regulator [candidate division KSB1 bacterium]|nr:MAG: XRE family transcriptional regulator [candidate division KSB1 bacterium]